MSEQGSDHKPNLDVDAEKDLTPGHGQREFVDDYPGDPDDDVAGTDSA